MRQTGHRREILLKHLDIVLITTLTLFLSPPGQPYGRTDKEEDTTDLSKNQTLEGAESKAWNLLRKRTQDLLDTRKCLSVLSLHCLTSWCAVMTWMCCCESDDLTLFLSHTLFFSLFFALYSSLCLSLAQSLLPYPLSPNFSLSPVLIISFRLHW